MADKILRRALFLCLLVLGLCGGASAEDSGQKVTVELQDTAGYGRMILTFSDRILMPEYANKVSNGVLSLQFTTPLTVKLDDVAIALSKYVSVARQDQDGQGLRFALTRGVKVNTIEAGAQLFVDFLPRTWQGEPPPLPPEIIKELARKAQEAIEKAREAEQRNGGRTIMPLVDFRFGESPTFSRFSFGWNVPFDTKLTRENESIRVQFNRNGELDLSDAKAHLPAMVTNIDSEVVDGRLSVIFRVKPSADVRAFRDGDAYVVDVVPPMATAKPHNALDKALQGEQLPKSAENVMRAPAQGGTPTLVEPAPAEGEAKPRHEEMPAKVAPAAKPEPHNSAKPVAKEPASALAVTAEAPPATVSAEKPSSTLGTSMVVPALTPKTELSPPTKAEVAPKEVAAKSAETPQAPLPKVEAAAKEPASPTEAAAAKPASLQEGGKSDVTALPQQPAARVMPNGMVIGPSSSALPKLVMTGDVETNGNLPPPPDPYIRAVGERVGTTARLVFPFPRPTNAAFFQRGSVMWMVFSDPSPMELAEVRSTLATVTSGLADVTGKDFRALRVDLLLPLFTSVEQDGNNWVVSIGETVIAPSRPLQLQRATSTDGTRILQVQFGTDGRIHDVIDPVVGDHIAVVTGMAPVRGLAKPQSLAEVDVLPSVQGLAFLTHADEVGVSISNDLVIVSKPGGLVLSIGGGQVGAAVPLSQRLGAERAGALGVGVYASKGSSSFRAQQRDLFDRVLKNDARDARVEAWYEMTKFYVAHQLGAEAQGALNVIQSIDGGEVDKPRFVTLRGAADIIMGRYEQGMKALSRDGVAQTPDAAFWRVIGATATHDYAEARRAYPGADRVAGTYPKELQTRLLMDAARSSIELRDFGNAATLLAQMDVASMTPNDSARLDLLGARIADASGHSGDAIEFLNHAVRIGKGPVEAEATYRLVRLQQREGFVTPAQAAKRLESLEVAWRGDEIELLTLKALAELSVDSGNYRRAFEAMRTAALVDPKSSVNRALQDEMSAAFATLYLDGAADNMRPIDALALFYDFKDLTPNGPRGDAMVRRLANRLVDVDLLPQAAELLSHQVESRLRGASRAQVAADLAMIYLLDRHPERALMTLSRTRQAQLPTGIERQRRVIEARALSETGKTDIALELLKPLRGLDIDRLRADINWQGNRYHDASAQIERLLGGRWGDEGPLSDAEQLDVLKAAVGFSLASDDPSRDRLRSKFLTKMSGTKNAAAFEVVTGPFTTNGYEFRSVADMVKTTDSLGAFLESYRKQYPPVSDAKTEPLAPAEAAPAATSAAQPENTPPEPDKAVPAPTNPSAPEPAAQAPTPQKPAA